MNHGVLSFTQREVLHRLRVNPDRPLVYIRGGFWTFADTAVVGSFPAWHYSTRTVEALERHGVLVHRAATARYFCGDGFDYRGGIYARRLFLSEAGLQLAQQDVPDRHDCPICNRVWLCFAGRGCPASDPDGTHYDVQMRCHLRGVYAEAGEGGCNA